MRQGSAGEWTPESKLKARGAVGETEFVLRDQRQAYDGMLKVGVFHTKPGGTAGDFSSCPSIAWDRLFVCPESADPPLSGSSKTECGQSPRRKEGIAMKKFFAILLSLLLILSLCPLANAEGKTYKIGICNYVDDASLNQIVENITARLLQIADERGVAFDVKVDVCYADGGVMNQIIDNFIMDGVDLMVGVATPVAIAMQTKTEDNRIPVVFAAVSDPVAAQLVESLEAPGANITGTSDFLNTDAVINLIFAANPDAKTIGLLYDLGQDAATTPITAARVLLEEKGVAYKEYNGTNVPEVMQAVDSLIADGVDAVFTPTDNTIMTAELSIYEKLADAGIPHYTGADSFALNGAFLGYGVDYANLGVETANMIAQILLDGSDPATTPVKTFDNGTATINVETAAKIGLEYDTVAEIFAPLCTRVQPITFAESFSDLQ